MIAVIDTSALLWEVFIYIFAVQKTQHFNTIPGNFNSQSIIAYANPIVFPVSLDLPDTFHILR